MALHHVGILPYQAESDAAAVRIPLSPDFSQFLAEVRHHVGPVSSLRFPDGRPMEPVDMASMRTSALFFLHPNDPPPSFPPPCGSRFLSAPEVDQVVGRTPTTRNASHAFVRGHRFGLRFNAKLMVTGVYAQAEFLGIEVYDQILSVNGRVVQNPKAFVRAVKCSPNPVVIGFGRVGFESDLKPQLPIPARPALPGDSQLPRTQPLHQDGFQNQQHGAHQHPWRQGQQQQGNPDHHHHQQQGNPDHHQQWDPDHQHHQQGNRDHHQQPFQEWDQDQQQWDQDQQQWDQDQQQWDPDQQQQQLHQYQQQQQPQHPGQQQPFQEWGQDQQQPQSPNQQPSGQQLPFQEWGQGQQQWGQQQPQHRVPHQPNRQPQHPQPERPDPPIFSNSNSSPDRLGEADGEVGALRHASVGSEAESDGRGPRASLQSAEELPLSPLALRRSSDFNERWEECSDRIRRLHEEIKEQDELLHEADRQESEYTKRMRESEARLNELIDTGSRADVQMELDRIEGLETERRRCDQHRGNARRRKLQLVQQLHTQKTAKKEMEVAAGLSLGVPPPSPPGSRRYAQGRSCSRSRSPPNRSASPSPEASPLSSPVLPNRVRPQSLHVRAGSVHQPPLSKQGQHRRVGSMPSSALPLSRAPLDNSGVAQIPGRHRAPTEAERRIVCAIQTHGELPGIASNEVMGLLVEHHTHLRDVHGELGAACMERFALSGGDDDSALAPNCEPEISLVVEVVFKEPNSPSDRREIRGGTLHALVEHLSSNAVADTDFEFVFLLMYRSFTTSQELLAHLKYRFHMAARDDEGDQASRPINRVRFRVVNVLRKWVEQYYCDFENDRGLLSAVMRFVSESVEPHDSLKGIVDCLKRSVSNHEGREQSQECEGSVQVRARPYKTRPRPKVNAKAKARARAKARAKGKQRSLGEKTILDFEPIEVAEQLTTMHSQLFRDIGRTELLYQNWSSANKAIRSPNLMAQIENLNATSFWVCRVVLGPEDAKERALLLSRVICIAIELEVLQNFHGVVAIVGALCSPTISGLARTWKCLKRADNDRWKALKARFSPDGNYSACTQAQQLLQPPCVPFMGLFQTHMEMLNRPDDFLDKERGIINFEKHRKLAAVILRILTLQQDAYALPIIGALSDALTQEILDMTTDFAQVAREQLARSKELEPRKEE